MDSPIVRSVFDGYKEATKGKRKKLAFDELDRTPFLFSSGYLNEMYEQAHDKEEYESILDHMYRHEATDIDSYKSIENKIVDKFWR